MFEENHILLGSVANFVDYFELECFVDVFRCLFGVLVLPVLGCCEFCWVPLLVEPDGWEF